MTGITFTLNLDRLRDFYRRPFRLQPKPAVERGWRVTHSEPIEGKHTVVIAEDEDGRIGPVNVPVYRHRLRPCHVDRSKY